VQHRTYMQYSSQGDSWQHCVLVSHLWCVLSHVGQNVGRNSRFDQNSVFEDFERSLEAGAGQETFQVIPLFLNWAVCTGFTGIKMFDSWACKFTSLKNEKA